ncbi:hypothetical protein I4U23_013714 [Adineta vaga]|nr:hypothetical protein I4U23_013714 [Adineta vaga]
MSDLKRFIINHRDFIENIIDLLIISAHYYISYNGYDLIKHDMVGELETMDLKNIGTNELTYANNIRKIALSMRRSKNDLIIYLEDCDTNRLTQSTISLGCDRDGECTLSLAYQKIIELYKWLNLKSVFFRKSIRTIDLLVDLIGAVTSLKPLAMEEDTYSPINIIPPSKQDEIGKGNLITPNPPENK